MEYSVLSFLPACSLALPGVSCLPVIDNGVLLLQYIIRTVTVEEANWQVRHCCYCALSKCEKTEEEDGGTGKKVVCDKQEKCV